MNISIPRPHGQETLTRWVARGRATIKRSTITSADKAFCQILEVAENGVPGMDMSSLYSTAQELEHFLEGLRRSSLDPQNIAVATSWICPNGRVKDIVAHGRQRSSGTPEEWVMEICDATEAHSATQLQKRQGKMLSTILEYAPVGFSLIFPDSAGNRIIGWYNPAISNIFGYDEHELLGATTRILYEDEKTFTHAGQYIKTQLEAQGICDFTTSMVRRNGTKIEARVVIVPVNIDNEVSYLSILEDITDQKQTEMLLHESKERYRTIVEGTENLVTEVDKEGRFTFVNEAARKIFGIEPAACFGKSAFDFVHPEDREKTLSHFQEWTRDKKESVTFENRQVSITGEVKDMLWTIKFHFTDEGDIASIKSIARDITDLNKAYDELRRSEEKYISIFQESPIGIFHYTKNGLITETNKKFIEIIGSSREQLVGLNMLTQLRDPKMIEAVAESIESGVSVFQGWYTSVTGNQTRYLQIQFKAIRDNQNQIIWGLGIVQDITEKKQAETELHRYQEQLENLVEERTKELTREKIRAEAANRAKSEFLANMSHEIRTPLNAVTGFSELLSSFMADEKQKSYLNAIKTAGKNLMLLINDILDLSKIEAEKLEIHYSSVNLNALFTDIGNMFELEASKKGLEFIAHVAGDLPPALLIDEIRLRQVLLNMVGNAVKFTERGYIRLTLESRPLETGLSVDIHITIEDTGIGITENGLETIFDSFRQETHPDSARYGGTGLGLAICKRLVEMMNGHIQLESHPGSGSTFKIILKNVIVDRRKSVTPEDTCHYGDLYFEKGKVLVVDDIDSNRHFLKELLENVNLDVLEAQNGQEAVLIAHDFHPDAILMDIRMPVMDGVTALAHLKKNEHTRTIPVFAISASTSTRDQATMLEKGFYGFIPKPVDVNRLLAELSGLLPAIRKNRAAQNPAQPSLSMEARAELPALVHTLESDFVSQWELLASIQPMDEVKAFAEGLVELGVTYDLSLLRDYGQNLTRYVENFEVSSMKESLNTFPGLISRLKSAMEEKSSV